MTVSQIVNESQLDAWVRGNSTQAQGKIVELVFRLVCASCSKPNFRRFPLEDSIGQHGADGKLETAVGFEPFIPEGKSIWEIGTNVNALKKANSDFKSSTESTPEKVRKETTYIFVTPLSGRRDWENTWKTDGISDWTEKKRALNHWKDIKVLDGCCLIDWVSQFPAVGHWLGTTIDQMPNDFDTAENYWSLISSFGSPPPLHPDLFINGRNDASEKLSRLLIDHNDNQLRFDTHFPEYSKYIVSGFLAALPEDNRGETQSKVLILRSKEYFKKACSLTESHVFVMDFNLNESEGHELIQRALNRRHAVIYSSLPGGIPHGNSCQLYTPEIHQMKIGLVKSGYSEERARTLTNQSGKDLNALLRLIQGMSSNPDWVTCSEASDFAIAQFIGQWHEASEGDQRIIEELSGKNYGEWIVNIRKLAGAKSAPLSYFNGRWKFTSRFEPWLYLGKFIGSEILESFEKVAIKILSESNPSFDLPKHQRYATAILGDKPKFSNHIRLGISETLALLGSHGYALSFCQAGKPQQTASTIVSELLNKPDSISWASLNDVLPLLAEAAPAEFLNAVGGASERPDEPFSGVFAQEGDGFLGGGNYITGLLWALESLAWSNEYLLRACGILANLAAIDPGGNFGNRPSNSLVDIFLPWLPQTAASMEKRHAAVKLISSEQPDVTWNLLLGLLPEFHSSSNYTHRPKWREFIPENWIDGATDIDKIKDEAFYADIAFELAGINPERLEKLLRFYFMLHPDFTSFASNLRARLQSDEVLALPQDQRLILWTALKSKIRDHRRYSDSELWYVPEEDLLELDKVAEKIQPKSPEIFYRHLFLSSDSDLFEGECSWEEKRQVLLQKRNLAIEEIVNKGGFHLLKNFWRSVESPAQVGNALGNFSPLADDSMILPDALESGDNLDLNFAKSYIWQRFSLGEWVWVDSVNCSNWSVKAKAQFYSNLPFVAETWKRVEIELSDDSSEYWKQTSTYSSKDDLERIDYALERLIDNGRSDVAINCFLHKDLWESRFSELGLRALERFDDDNHIDSQAIGELFNHLQNDDSIDENRLVDMEIKFLELLSRFHNAHPRTLYRHLAEQPDFFCQIIRTVFRLESNSEKQSEKEAADNEKELIITRRGYRILMGWNHPPGLLRDGVFNKKGLLSWAEAVKQEFLDSENWKIASNYIGQVLFYAPKDENGLWIEPVCDFLDSKADNEFRIGLRIKIFNSRGAHLFSEGKEEMKLAKKWEAIANLAENKGYARLGSTLRSLSNNYEKEAEQDVLENQHRFD
ncbi:MAG: hypothetical protein CVV64_10385 [Candidatus Wallbacteria bacterium HGW-Wallbacteria-1]|uniref:Uncharacterized protein n=1 Tax=Candidatus Wallbacteria bacterium HGW-Wallbacteria-1 TaxID=2013854 RepID=A0A2N1PPV7_9BACT|nr:MAG: hypothetical protein CVV64_10385 [Candidatus Wallbacteria bacterium HGW-Wallbacteria-1]